MLHDFIVKIDAGSIDDSDCLDGDMFNVCTFYITPQIGTPWLDYRRGRPQTEVRPQQYNHFLSYQPPRKS